MFSNFTSSKKVLQFSFIDVNEKGTEAAAATVVKMMKRSIVHTYEVTLNRPFMYFITEKSTGLVLFSGCFRGEEQPADESSSHQEQPNSTQSLSHSEL
jgi:serine protease inhibitor